MALVTFYGSVQTATTLFCRATERTGLLSVSSVLLNGPGTPSLTTQTTLAISFVSVAISYPLRIALAALLPATFAYSFKGVITLSTIQIDYIGRCMAHDL